MNCAFCATGIRVTASKLWVEVRRYSGHMLVFGNVPLADGPLEQARGELEQAYHKKCWLAKKRRDQLQAAKDADPSAQHREPADWRSPQTAELEGMQFRESDRDT